MNFKVTLILLLLVAAGYVAFLWLDKQKPVKPDVPLSTRAGTELWTADARFNSEKVTQITISAGEKSYVFTRDAAPSASNSADRPAEPQWNQTQPVAFPLEGYRINALVSEIYGLRFTTKAKPGESGMPALDAAGLSPAVATITLKDTLTAATTKPTGRDTMTIKLGKTSIGGRAYAMINDDPNIYVVGDEAHKAFVKPNFDDLRQSRLTAPNEGRAARVVLSRVIPGAKPSVISVSKNEGRWAFDVPNAGRVDREQVSTVLSAISSFSASNFVSEDAARLPIYGLDQPSISLAITAPQTSGDKDAASTSTFRIGNSADITQENFYATWSTSAAPSPVVFTVPRSVIDSLSKDVDALRDKRIAPLAANDVVELQIDRAGMTLGFAKSPSGWAFAPLNPLFTAESSAVTKIVEAITSITADKFVQGAPAADLKPAASIKLTATGRAEPDVLRFFADHPEKTKSYTVYRNSEAIGHVIAAEKLSSVFVGVPDVRSLKVITFKPDALTGVTLQRAGRATLQFERTPPPGTQPSSAPAIWKLTGAERFESSAFESMLQSLLPLIAEKWLNDPASALGDSAIKLTFQRGTAAPVTLSIDPGTRHAAASTDAAQFLLPSSAITKLQEEFTDRTVLPIDGRDITAITITDQDQKPVEIARDPASGFIALDGRKLDTNSIGKIVDAAAGLRVERYNAGADRSAVTRGLTFTTVKGDKFTLSLLASGSAMLTGKLNGAEVSRAFSLDAATIKSLNSPLVPKAEPAEDNMNFNMN